MKKKLLKSLVIVWVLAFISGCAFKVNEAGLNDLDIIASDTIKKDSQYKLVFFGYAGCYHFCDPRLRQIDPIYEALKGSLDLKVLFIDISQESSLEAASSFVKDVNTQFEAIYPDPKHLKLLQKEFQDVYIRKMPDGEYLHSGFLYLLKRSGEKYYLLKIYAEFDKSQSMIEDIKKLTAP